MFRRNRGISLLIPTQNAERTVALCIRSFADFADEIIAVDNGSTDASREIVRELTREFDHLQFFDAPQLKDLYENRQFALQQSRFNWIARLDSDYVAFTSGPNDIKYLRNRILETSRTFPPLAFKISQINLTHDLLHTGDPERSGQGIYVQPPTNSLAARIVQWFPGLRFERIGRWEGVRFQKYLKHRSLESPYWFHCNLKSKRDYLFRSERTNWRSTGAFDRFPTLESYLLDVIQTKYQTASIQEAADIHFEQEIKQHLQPYRAESYLPYPELLQQEIDRGNILLEQSPADDRSIAAQSEPIR